MAEFEYPCLARLDRYNHEIENDDTEDEDTDLMFSSFSSCSPRYSKVNMKFDEVREVSLTVITAPSAPMHN